MAKLKYQVVSTCDWDSWARKVQGATGDDIKKRLRERNLPQRLTPNAPMAARDTLLAQLLRTGRYAMFEYTKECPSPARIILKHPKKRPEYVGRLLGVEIEYYPSSDTLPKSNRLTDVGDDGSLNSGGREIRRITWAAQDGRLHGLLALKLKGRVDKTCGLHVHVDVRHLGTEPRLGQPATLGALETYQRLIKLYPMLKQLCLKSRWQNRFCKWVDNSTSGERYAAINYCSFDEHGTLEFRCQGGTTNLVKIETWALICQYLVKWCADPCTGLPQTWAEFVAILPEPLRSWAILRKQKLHGQSIQLDERSLSAVRD